MKYQLERITSEDIQREVSKLVEGLKTDTNLRQEAVESGINLSALDQRLRDQEAKNIICITPSGAGADPGTVAIIVAFVAPVVTTIAKDLWRLFILRKLKQKFGQDSITSLDDDAK